jgi:hypothetical protein
MVVVSRFRFTGAAGLAVCLVTLSVLFAAGAAGDDSKQPGGLPPASQATPATPSVDSVLPEASPGERVREGTNFHDRLGSFLPVGGRIVFVTSDGKQRLIALENLCLERVIRVIGDRPAPFQWVVTGTVTEFHGSNYLLVTEATLRSGGMSGTPRQRVAEHGKNTPVTGRVGAGLGSR